jgi:spermidine synthase
MRIWLVAIGCLSMLGQVVVLREVSVAFYGVELVLLLALAVWLAGTALGALLVAHGQRGHERDIRRPFLLFALLLLAAVVFLRGSRRLFHAVPGAYLGLPVQMLVLGIGVLPVAATLGVLFVRAARRAGTGRGALARAYALESAGALAGGLASTLLLAAGVQNLTAAGLAAALAAAAGAWPWRRSDPACRVAAGLAAALLAGTIALSARLDRSTTAWNHPQLLASRDTPYGRLTLTDAAGQIAVFEDDALAAESQSPAAEILVHFAGVQRDSLPSVLALGGLVPGLLPEILAHPVRRVEDVETCRALVELVGAHAPSRLLAASRDPRVQMHIGDPRRFLAHAARYDLVLVGMPEPESGRTNRYYTREFFALVARHLNPGGVLALRLRGAENLWTPLAQQRLASVHAALCAVFPDVVVVPGSTHVLLASGAPLDLDPEILAARLRNLAVQPLLVTPAYLRYAYTNDRFSAMAALLQRAPQPANSDLRPACYQATMLGWLARFYPRLTRLEWRAASPREVLRSPWCWAAAGCVLFGAGLARRRPVWRASAYVALAGGAGMLLESALLLRYQAQTGVLYQDLGLLLTAFMLGLAVGSETVHRSSAAGMPGARAPSRARLGACLVLVAAALGVALSMQVAGGASLGLVGLLLAGAGLGVGAAFGAATTAASSAPAAALAPVYAADLLGGAVGSLLAAVWLAPLLGLTGTALVAAGCALLALGCL